MSGPSSAGAARAAPRRAPGRLGRARRAVAEARAEDLFLYSAALAFYGLISVARW